MASLADMARCEMHFIIACTLVLLFASSSTLGENAPANDAVDPNADARPCEQRLAKLSCSLRQKLDDAGDELDRLLQQDDTTLSLFAGWELIIEKTLAESSLRNGHQTSDIKDVDWFLGFLEGKASVRVPQWWKAELQRAKISIQESAGEEALYLFSFPFLRRPPHIRPDDPLILSDPGTTVSLSGDRLNIGGEIRQCLSLPPSEIFRSKSPADYMAQGDNLFLRVQKTTKDRIVVLLHGVFLEDQCILSVISSDTERVLWTRELCLSDPIPGGYSGPGPFCGFSLAVDGERALIFGVSAGGLSASGFDLDDGRRDFLFFTQTPWCVSW